jgi:signal transduction histidine kinase
LKRLIFLFLSFLLLFNCTKNNASPKITTATKFYEHAVALNELKLYDSAFVFFNKAKIAFLQENDNLKGVTCLINMAIIAIDYGDNFGGQEILFEALNYLDKKKKEHFDYLQSTYNTLGIASSNLKEYAQSIEFYNQCRRYSSNGPYLLVLENNIGNAYREKGDYDKAIAIYSKILNKRSKDDGNYAKTLTNYAVAKWLQNSKYNAVPELLKALHIRQKAQDFWGLNSSYSHLSGYYSKILPDSALYYANKMYEVNKKINSPDDRLESLKKLVRFSTSQNYKQYFDSYDQLDDSLQTARRTAKNQFALIRYQTEKHKADNLVLQQENTEKNYQLILLVSGAILLLVAGVFLYKKRKQKLELEAKNTIKESQLKTSKKVHDVVANGLYRVMTEIENQDNMDKEEILDRLDHMYQKSRDISYEVEELKQQHQDFSTKVKDLLVSFNTQNTKVQLSGNTPKIWESVSVAFKYEVEHILQELMVNMTKHSSATNVELMFEHHKNQIHIYYVDNGVGMPKDIQFKNGLTNTGNRINIINGAITFDTEVEKGLKIQISFPVS